MLHLQSTPPTLSRPNRVSEIYLSFYVKRHGVRRHLSSDRQTASDPSGIKVATGGETLLHRCGHARARHVVKFSLAAPGNGNVKRRRSSKDI